MGFVMGCVFLVFMGIGLHSDDQTAVIFNGFMVLVVVVLDGTDRIVTAINRQKGSRL